MTDYALTPVGIVEYHYHCVVPGCRYDYVMDRAENEPYDVLPFERSYEEADVIVSHGICAGHLQDHYPEED